MNKKLFAVLLSCVTAANLYAQEDNNQETTSTKSGFNHWSVQARGGLSLMSYAETPREDYFKGKSYNANALLTLEYTFTPLWGMGFDAGWVNNNQSNYNNHIYTFNLFASINLSNWLSPNRKWRRFNSYLNVGIGGPLTSYSNAYYLEDGEKHYLEDDTRWARPFFKPGLLAEYDFHNSWAVGLYMDVLTGMTRQNNHENSLCIHPTENGGRVILLGGLSARYKFGGERNIRNVIPADFMTASTDNGCCDELKKLLDDYKAAQDKRMDSLTNAMNDEIADLKSETKSLRKDLRETQDSLEALKHRCRVYVNKPSAEDLNTINTAMAKLRFETAKAIIMPGSFANLDRIVDLMKKHPTWHAKIEGHTDNVGDDVFNQKLSDDRAAAVVQYLANKGISVSRLSSQGFGETRPVADNKTEYGRAKNRRVELEVIVK